MLLDEKPQFFTLEFKMTLSFAALQNCGKALKRLLCEFRRSSWGLLLSITKFDVSLFGLKTSLQTRLLSTMAQQLTCLVPIMNYSCGTDYLSAKWFDLKLFCICFDKSHFSLTRHEQKLWLKWIIPASCLDGR